MSGLKIIIEKELGAIPSVAEMEVVDILRNSLLYLEIGDATLAG